MHIEQIAKKTPYEGPIIFYSHRIPARQSFIEALAQFNFTLAVRCKVTSRLPELNIVNSLISIAKTTSITNTDRLTDILMGLALLDNPDAIRTILKKNPTPVTLDTAQYPNHLTQYIMEIRERLL